MVKPTREEMTNLYGQKVKSNPQSVKCFGAQRGNGTETNRRPETEDWISSWKGVHMFTCEHAGTG